MGAASPSDLCFPGLDKAARDQALAHELSGALRDDRAAAWNRYAALPLPSPSDEDWRRTDPAALGLNSVRPLPPLPVVFEPPDPHPLDSEFDLVVALDDTAIRIADRSGILGNDQVRIGAPNEAEESEPALDADGETDKLAWANRVFWNAGLTLRISEGARLKRGILIRGRADRPGAVWLPRIRVEAARDSRLDLAQIWESPEDADARILSTTHVSAASGARVRGLSAQALGRRGKAVWTESVSAAAGAKIEWTSLQLGAGFSLNRIAGAAIGEGAELRLRGLCVLDGDRHGDQKTLQDHRAPDTVSDLLFKCIVRDRARSVFRGVIRARPGAVRLDAYQKNSNLVLDDGARADSLPGLRIDADDLKCTHGSTIGNLDPDALYYLQTRGLSLSAARTLMMEGFAGDILSGIPWPGLRDHALAWVRERLAIRES